MRVTVEKEGQNERIKNDSYFSSRGINFTAADFDYL